MDKIEVGLSKFIEFTIKQGPAKLSVVRTFKAQEANAFSPAVDYWGQLRSGIVEMHKKDYPFTYLDHIVEKVTDKKKSQYRTAINEYKKIFQKKNIEFFQPGKAFWSHESLAVKATPELGLIINGVPHLIKLYLRDDNARFDRWTTAAVLTLMAHANYSKPIDDPIFSIVNVKKGKWLSIQEEIIKPDNEIVLQGEATHFIELYNKL